MKHLIQRDGYSCAPVAIYNALLTRGKRIALKKLVKMCGCGKGIGTSLSRFEKVAAKVGLNIKQMQPRRVDDKGTYFVSLLVERAHRTNYHMVLVHKGLIYNLLANRQIKGPRKLNWVTWSILMHRAPNKKNYAWRVL